MLALPDNERRSLPIKVLLLVILGVILLVISTQRRIGRFDFETDFYGGFIPEAQRILAGEALHLEWHPPFYPLVLGGVYLLIGDWFRSGLLISVFAAIVAIAATYCCFRDLYDRIAALGAAVGLALWPHFLVGAVSASSDALFLSLMMTSLAVAVGGKTLTGKRCLLAGVLAGLASLTRTNGITLILIALLCGGRASAGRGMRAAAAALAGFLLPWSVWFMASRATDSPVLPVRTYIDIAVAFFGPEGARHSSNSDNWALAETRFSSLLDVILFDPPTLIGGILRNICLNFWKSFNVAGALSLPLGIAALVSIVWLVLQRTKHGGRLGLWLVYASQYALVAFRSFGSRYYVFLVPAIGAGAFSLGSHVAHRMGGLSARSRLVAILAGAAGFLAIAAFDARHLRRHMAAEPVEIIEAAALLKARASSADHVIAIKPHIGFYSGLRRERLPAVGSEAELYQAVCSERPQQEAFLFFGRAEAGERPELRALETPGRAPGWLVPVGHGGEEGASWALYEVDCSVATEQPSPDVP